MHYLLFYEVSDDYVAKRAPTPFLWPRVPSAAERHRTRSIPSPQALRRLRSSFVYRCGLSQRRFRPWLNLQCMGHSEAQVARDELQQPLRGTRVAMEMSRDDRNIDIIQNETASRPLRGESP